MDERNSILSCRVRFRRKFQAYIIHSSQFVFKKGKAPDPVPKQDPHTMVDMILAHMIFFLIYIFFLEILLTWCSNRSYTWYGDQP